MSNVALSWWSLFPPSRLVKWITWTRFKPRFVCSKADKHKFFLKLWDLNSNFTLTWVILNQLWTTHPGVIRSFCTFGTVPAFVRLIDQQGLMKPSLNWRWLCISVYVNWLVASVKTYLINSWLQKILLYCTEHRDWTTASRLWWTWMGWGEVRPWLLFLTTFLKTK